MLPKFGYTSKKFLVWLIANTLGFGALGALILVFPSILGISGFFATMFIVAIPISLAQWIALRRILQTSILWVLTIPIGIPLSFLILRVIPAGLWFGANDDSLIALTSMFLVIGLIIGLLQWIILRLQLARATIWLLGSVIGVAGSFWLIIVTDLINQSGIISYIVVALVYSCVTGLVLSGLLAYNNQSQTNLMNAT
ncbi:MAG: hypothetical protein KJ638_06595 [Chloroflexi bacterium]|nr:hypothetical protein [Chloroflexota bacterium]